MDEKEIQERINEMEYEKAINLETDWKNEDYVPFK